MFIYLSICLSVFLSVFLSLSVCLFVCLSVCLSVWHVNLFENIKYYGTSLNLLVSHHFPHSRASFSRYAPLKQTHDMIPWCCSCLKTQAAWQRSLIEQQRHLWRPRSSSIGLLFGLFLRHLGMDQYLLIPFLGEWTSIYQLFWCSPGVQYKVLTHCHLEKLHQVVFPQNGLDLLTWADVCGLSWVQVTLSLCGVSFINSWMSTISTLWLFNIAMENGPFIDGLPIKNGDFPWLC